MIVYILFTVFFHFFRRNLLTEEVWMLTDHNLCLLVRNELQLAQERSSEEEQEEITQTTCCCGQCFHGLGEGDQR